MSRVLLLLAITVLGGCAGGGAPEPATADGTAACEATDGELAAGATLADHAGTYRLTLVRSDGPDLVTVRGRLMLVPRPVSMRRLEGWTTPLAGSAAVDLQGVGATAFGTVESDDPMSPGVLVLESAGDPPTILLRLGSSANRTDRTDRRAFEEAFTALTVRAVDDGAFAGSWRSAVGTSQVSGHFCAVRAD